MPDTNYVSNHFSAITLDSYKYGVKLWLDLTLFLPLTWPFNSSLDYNRVQYKLFIHIYYKTLFITPPTT